MIETLVELHQVLHRGETSFTLFEALDELSQERSDVGHSLEQSDWEMKLKFHVPKRIKNPLEITGFLLI